MRLSDIIAGKILELLESSQEGTAEIARNELANAVGCVPSQINYVITSRFTPEQGYIVESRRGGGGYVRITRVQGDKTSTVMHIINSIGTEMDPSSARILLNNLLHAGIIPYESAVLMNAALSEKAYVSLPQSMRAAVRAAVLKQMLMTVVTKG